MATSTTPGTLNTSTKTATSTISPAAALTTIFTPSSFCTLPVTYEKNPDYACLPPSYSLYWNNNAGLTRNDYYSPAICPSGMTIGGSRSAIGQGPPLTDGETAMICCATGYTVTPSLTRNCVSGEGAGKATAVAVQIRWRERDLVGLETDPLTPGVKAGKTVGVGSSSGGSSAVTSRASATATPSSTASSSPVPAATAGSIAETPSSNRGMSIGSKAGIGAGVGLAVVFLLTCLIFFLRRRPKRSKQANVASELEDPKYSTAQLPAQAERVVAVHELPHYEPPEMATTTQRTEQTEAVQASPLSSHPVNQPEIQTAAATKEPSSKTEETIAKANVQDTEIQRLKVEEERIRQRLKDLENL